MNHLKYWLTIPTVLVTLIAASTALGNEKSDVTQDAARLNHAKELLGKSYQKSAIHQSESKEDLSPFLTETTRRFLPKAYQSQAEKIANALKNEANKYELDPVFLMAIIQNESSFNPAKTGRFGEIGLMQIKPKTAAWLAKEYHLAYQNEKTLKNPISNIEIGAAFVDKLRTQFDSESQLYLSAYNIGASKVRKMVSANKMPKVYVHAVMKRYLAIYSAFNTEGDSKVKSMAAWNNVKDATRKITRKVASARVASVRVASARVASTRVASNKFNSGKIVATND